MGYDYGYAIKGTKKYNSVGGINPSWIDLASKREEEKQEREKRRQEAEDYKRTQLDLLTKQLEVKFDFLKKHSSSQEDIVLALKVLKSVSL